MKNIQKIKVALVLALCLPLVLTSCKKDDTPAATGSRDGGFLVVNEGGFGKGNATLGYVNTNNEYEDAVFETENDRKLGDIFQSILESDEYYFMSVNNSAKIEILNKSTLKSTGTLENLGSPRYMVEAGGKVWVQDLFAAKLTYFDIASPTSTSTLTLNAAASSITSTGAFVHLVVNGKLVSVDSKAIQQSSDSMDYGLKLVMATSNSNNEIYALGKGGSDSLFGLKINSTNMELVSKVFIEVNTSWLSAFNYSAVNGAFSFYDKNTIYSISTEAFDKIDKIATPSEATYVYSYSVHPITGDFYITDAKDFVQSGEVFHTSNTGEVLNKIQVGINPNACHF